MCCSPRPLGKLSISKVRGYAGHRGGIGGKGAPLPGFRCRSVQVQEHKDLLVFLFHLISLQRLCLMSYPCLKGGIYLLLLLSRCRGATRLFVWFNPARITLCLRSQLAGWVCPGHVFRKIMFFPYSAAACPAATAPFPLNITRGVAGCVGCFWRSRALCQGVLRHQRC